MIKVKRIGWLPEKAQEIKDLLKYDFNFIYEDSASIGKRYARQDLTSTPFCIAVDHQTLEDISVTICHRDTTGQERVTISELHGRFAEATSFRRIFEMI